MKGVFKRFKVWRGNCRLKQIMRGTPYPVPSEGLKERLIRQVPAAGRELDGIRVRRRWAVLIPAGVALLMIGGWLGWQSLRPVKPSLGGVARLSQEKPPPPQAAKEVPGPRVHPKAATAAAPLDREPVVNKTRRIPVRQKRHRLVVKKQEGPAEVPAIQVRVSDTRQDPVGYARAASWTTDEQGQRVKTEWTLVYDTRSGTSREEMSVTDESGQRQALTVALAPQPREKMEQ